jgi:predicted aspartyl protease
VKTSRFDPARPLIYVVGRVWGPLGSERLSLVLDTGASMTLLAPEVLDDLGYSPRDGVARTHITSATSQEPGYTIRVSRFTALGFRCTNFLVHAFDLTDRGDIDGLIGLDYLRQFNYEIRSTDGQIHVERV